MEAAGRSADDIIGAAYLTVVFGEKLEAERQLAEHSQLYYGAPHDVISAQQASTAGPIEHVGEWVKGFIDAGASHLCVRLGCEDVAGQLEILAGLLTDLRSER